MMDFTRAALYFARGAILVEGVSEGLLVPVLAKRLGHYFRNECVSAIPICGVSFATFRKLLFTEGLSIPVSIVSDGDPPVRRGDTWREDLPEREDADADDESSPAYRKSARALKLQTDFADHPNVQVWLSTVTLEFDLVTRHRETPV